MIRAIIFDLDGVLVQSENLKALSYAKVVQELLHLPEPDSRAIEAYREIVGAPRDVAAKYVVDKLELEKVLAPHMSKEGVSHPFEVLTKMRLRVFSKMFFDPKAIRENQFPHTVEALRSAREWACRTGIATMSQRDEAEFVLRSLGVEQFVDVIVAAEDIKRGKPDPEVYLIALKKLQVAPGEALALEDSVTGVKAALAAGTNVIAIATSFTEKSLEAKDIIDKVSEEWIVHNLEQVPDVVRRRVERENRSGRPSCVSDSGSHPG